MLKPKKQLLFIFVTVFLSGIIIGIVTGIFIGNHVTKNTLQNNRPKTPPFHGRRSLLTILSKELSLDPEQEKQVSVIIKEMDQFRQKMHIENMQKTKQEVNKYFDKIRQLLTPEQLKKFNAFHKAMQEKIKKKFPSRHHPDKTQKTASES